MSEEDQVGTETGIKRLQIKVDAHPLSDGTKSVLASQAAAKIDLSVLERDTNSLAEAIEQTAKNIEALEAEYAESQKASEIFTKDYEGYTKLASAINQVLCFPGIVNNIIENIGLDAFKKSDGAKANAEESLIELSSQIRSVPFGKKLEIAEGGQNAILVVAVVTDAVAKAPEGQFSAEFKDAVANLSAAIYDVLKEDFLKANKGYKNSPAAAARQNGYVGTEITEASQKSLLQKVLGGINP